MLRARARAHSLCYGKLREMETYFTGNSGCSIELGSSFHRLEDPRIGFLDFRTYTQTFISFLYSNRVLKSCPGSPKIGNSLKFINFKLLMTSKGTIQIQRSSHSHNFNLSQHHFTHNQSFGPLSMLTSTEHSFNSKPKPNHIDIPLELTHNSLTLTQLKATQNHQKNCKTENFGVNYRK